MRCTRSCFIIASSCRRSHSALLPRGCNLSALFLSIYVEWDERPVDLLGTPSEGAQGSGTTFTRHQRTREGFFLRPRDCHRRFHSRGEGSCWKSQRPRLHWLFVSASVLVHPPIFQEKNKEANFFFKRLNTEKKNELRSVWIFVFFVFVYVS